MKRQRRAAWRSLILVATAITMTLTILGGCARGTGPMPVTLAYAVKYPLQLHETMTWGMPLPALPPPSGEGFVLRIEPIGIEGLEVIGVLACDGSTVQPDGSRLHCAPGTALGWPPVGVSTHPVEGIALDTDGEAGVLIGVRRLSSNAEGSISAIRISYVVGDIAYEVVQPWSLTLLGHG
jgi:hypothetical protein